MSVRPPNNRTLSSKSEVELRESLSPTTSSLSSPSIADDQDPVPTVVTAAEMTGGTLGGAVAGDEERRGRSIYADPSKYDNMDPRDMSPRRDSEELAQLGADAKAKLEAQAKSLQSGLLALLERVEKVREEHDKLEGENRFLQEYIGSLMATSKITGTAPANNRRNAGSRLR